MILSLSSDTLPLDQVDNYADVILSQQVSRIDGVGLVNIGGAAEAGRAHPHRSAQGRRPRPADRQRPRRRSSPPPTNAPKGSIVGPQRGSDRLRQRPDPGRRAVERSRRRLPQRRAGPDQGHRRRHPERRKQPDRRLGLSGKGQHRPDLQGRPEHSSGHLQGARRQRHQDRGPDPRGPARPAGEHPAGHRHPRSDGPDPDHQRLGQGREDHPADHHRSGGDRHLPLPAQRARDPHSQRRHPAGAAGGHRGDAAAASSASTTCR